MFRNRIGRLATMAALAFGLAACHATKDTATVSTDAPAGGRVLFSAPEGTDPNYAAQLGAAVAVAASQADQVNSITTIAASCKDDPRCVEHVAAVAALSRASAQQAVQIPQYQPKPSFWAQLGLGIVQQIPGLAGAAVNWHQADNSRATAVAQFNMLEGIVRSSNETATAISASGPRITVGGNYGDTYGANYTGNDRTETNTTVGGNQSGRDTNTGSVVGDGNRIGSPGPFENVGNCTAGAGAGAGAGGAGGATPGGTGGAGGNGGDCTPAPGG